MNMQDVNDFGLRGRVSELQETLFSLEEHRAQCEELGIPEEDDLEFRIESVKGEIDDLSAYI